MLTSAQAAAGWTGSREDYGRDHAAMALWAYHRQHEWRYSILLNSLTCECGARVSECEAMSKPRRERRWA